ncbi:cysteine desulfurase-like protein [Alsobacter soli]|uniref:Cysteine desulfurase-like protein n=1 Tax=Alsobacter soli TaxID=2109933 RepID=A0A2T1HNN1_9HYPH|nr:cysteine desulfurase-like protein [Alsobacter soli]PSC03242.1 cysteine desulfurase-like protein [Alsobacter soli]
MTTPPTLDLHRVRSRFPALAADDWAYFDNAGGSLVLGGVAARISEYLLTTSVQTGASYPASVRAVERLAAARARIATLVGAARSDEIVLGPSTTVLLRFLATAMAGQLAEGDEIIVTDFDHESNIGPWMGLRDRGVVVRTWSADPATGEIDLAALDALLTPRTRLVCVTHASNILGTINPIREIAKRVHAAGARLCVDAVAYAPHRAVDVQASGADYYVFSFYKVYGPHFAVLWGRHEYLLELDGLYHYFYGKDVVPGKLEPGNTNYELAWGSAGIVDYLEEIGGASGRAGVEQAFAAIAAHEERLAARLLDWLNSRNDARVVGLRRPDRAARVPTISFTFEGKRSDDVVRAVEKDQIAIRFGDFHSRRLVEHLGLARNGGVVRVSMVHYNTLEEVDRLTRALENAVR